jgi:hypothetical protein
MWIIELNIAGHRFTRSVPDLRRRTFRFSPRNGHGHVPQLRDSHAA